MHASSARNTTAVDFTKVFMLFENTIRKMSGININCGFARVAKPHERPARIKNPMRPEARINNTAPRRNKKTKNISVARNDPYAIWFG